MKKFVLYRPGLKQYSSTLGHTSILIRILYFTPIYKKKKKNKKRKKQSVQEETEKENEGERSRREDYFQSSLLGYSS